MFVTFNMFLYLLIKFQFQDTSKFIELYDLDKIRNVRLCLDTSNLHKLVNLRHLTFATNFNGSVDNLPSTLARDSSSLFAKNLLNFLSPHVNKENKTIDFDWEDETVKNTLVTKGGEMVNELLKDK